MSVYMPKINYILLIYRNLFLSPTYTSKLLLLNSLIEFLGAKTDIHFAFLWNIFTWLIFGVVRLLFCSIKIIM